MRRTDSTNLLGRLEPILPAYTINTQFYNVTTGCYTHPFEDRALSVREGARIQTFPDTYKFSGSLPSKCRQIGNAVPPVLAAVLAASIAQSILGDNLPSEWKPPKVIKPAAEVPAPPGSGSTRQRMLRQKRSGTRPENLLFDELLNHGLKPERSVQVLADVRRTADLVFSELKIAIFVDGCFWHGCPDHARPTKSNTVWWADKIAKNRARDIETKTLLEAAGWTVVRVWEHEDPSSAGIRVREIANDASARGREAYVAS
jgi:DNA mismatch endonuclease Vsr